MSSSNRRRISAFISAIVVLLILGCPLWAQERQDDFQNLRWAQAFLWTFYPDMKGHRYTMTATTSYAFDTPLEPRGNVGVQIGDFPPGTALGGMTCTNGIVGEEPPKMKCSPILPKQFINATFAFNNMGHLGAFASEGPAVGKPEQYERFKESVRSHPEWTDAQANSALLQTGASYGPDAKEKLMKTLPLDELEKLFGKIAVVSSEFESLYGDHPPACLFFFGRSPLRSNSLKEAKNHTKCTSNPLREHLCKCKPFETRSTRPNVVQDRPPPLKGIKETPKYFDSFWFMNYS